jgi:hypothetical protein
MGVKIGLRQLWRRFTARPPLLTYKLVEEDVPPRAKPNVVYGVVEEGSAWQAVLVCPCGCQKLIRLSLLRDDWPHWLLTCNADGTATLHPSIWRTIGCRSHFFVRNGEIVWCPYGHGERDGFTSGTCGRRA